MKKLFIILSIVLPSCIQHDAKEIVEISLSGDKVNINSDASLFEILYANDTILIAGIFSNISKLCAFRLDNSEEYHEFLYVGRGPFEVNQSKFKCFEDTIHVMSHTPFGMDGVIMIPINAVQNKTKWKYHDFSDLRSMPVGGDFDVVSDSEYIVLGEEYNNKNILSIVGVDTKSYKKSIAFWPVDAYEGSVISKQALYMNASKVFGRNDKVLYACSEGKYVSILDVSVSPPIEHPIYRELPIYEQASDGLNPKCSSKSKRGVYAYATDSLIFISPLECMIKDGKYIPDNYKGYPPYYNDKIEVYDWNGEYLHTYVLDIPFCNFYVCDNNGELYVLTSNRETMFSEVYKYSLIR